MKHLFLLLFSVFVFQRSLAQPRIFLNLPGTAAPGDTITAAIMSADIDSMVSLQFSLNWHADQMEMLGYVSPWLLVYDSNAEAGLLTANWFDLSAMQPMALPDSSVVLSLFFRIKKCPGDNLVLRCTDSTQLRLIGFYQNGSTLELPMNVSPDTLLVSAEPVFARKDTAACAGMAIEINAACESCSYLWSTGETTAAVMATTPGAYAIRVTDLFACIRLDTINVFHHAATIPVISGPGFVCPGEPATLRAFCEGCDYLWSTGAWGDSLQTFVPGEYQVMAKDTHGCEGQADFLLAAVPQIAAMAEAIAPPCEGQTGSVEILATGGVPPFQYAVDGGGFSSSAVFEGLMPGQYSMVIKDAAGCVATLSALVEAPPHWALSLSPADTTIAPGAALSLAISSNLTMEKVLWMPSAGLSCDDCPAPSFVGTTGQEYQVLVSIGGTCTQMLGASVRLDSENPESDETQVFIPNVFMPGVAGPNGRFNVFCADPAAEVSQLAVYDRWGSLVASPLEPSQGWDGFCQGKMVNPGVYAYLIRIRFPGGAVKEYHGEVTLVL